MRLTDKDILAVIRDLGTASAGQIVAEVTARYPDQDRDPRRVRAMLPSLIRYHFIEYIEQYGRRYYYIAGTSPENINDAPLRARVMDFLNASPGVEYSTHEIAERIGTTPDYAIRLLRSIPGIDRRRISSGSVWGVKA